MVGSEDNHEDIRPAKIAERPVPSVDPRQRKIRGWITDFERAHVWRRLLGRAVERDEAGDQTDGQTRGAEKAGHAGSFQASGREVKGVLTCGTAGLSRTISWRGWPQPRTGFHPVMRHFVAGATKCCMACGDLPSPPSSKTWHPEALRAQRARWDGQSLARRRSGH